MTDGQPRHSRRSLMRAAGITAAAGAFAAHGHGSVSARGRAPAAGNFPEVPEWNFVFVNHVTTNPFWVPTIYGIEDAAALLGLPTSQWTGSDSSDVGQMVDTFEAAIAGGANGIAVSLVDLEAFNEPVQRRWTPGFPSCPTTPMHPTPAWRTSARTCTGPASPWVSGSSRSSARARWALFIATPGQLNIQPRIDGALDAIARVRRRHRSPGHRHRPGSFGGAGQHRGVVPRQHRRSRDVRRRRRQHGRRGPGRTEPERTRRRGSSVPVATTCSRSRSSCSPKA